MLIPHSNVRCHVRLNGPLNSENHPLENCLIKSGILLKIRLETTENVFLDAKNAFLAAREDTNSSDKVSALTNHGGR